MPEQHYIPRQDAEFLTFCRTLLSGVALNPAAYGVQPADVAPLQEAVAEFGQQLQHIDLLEAQRMAEVAGKRQQRRELEAAMRALAQKIQSDPTVEEHLKVEVGLPRRDRVPGTAAPVAPTKLVVEAQSNGVNELKWSRAGNPRNTEFLIEARIGSALEYGLVDVVRGARYTHSGVRPGTAIVYRVLARHSHQVSGPSNEAGAYL